MWSCVSSSISRSSTWYRSMSAFVGSFGRFTATGAPLNRPRNTAEAGPSWILVRPVANADFGAAKGTEVDVQHSRKHADAAFASSAAGPVSIALAAETSIAGGGASAGRVALRRRVELAVDRTRRRVLFRGRQKVFL